MTTTLAFAAGSWAIVMGLAPLLQVRRMLVRRSSADVSLGYLLVLLPGFALWFAYGLAVGDAALVIPNAVAFLVDAGTIGCVLVLRGALRPR
ncbi:MAG TPA: SemiSWEET family transporter [Jatrophihabitans sp.]|nr:SemiSWEET family transporter [Jatrophihabitans sp.]